MCTTSRNTTTGFMVLVAGLIICDC